MEVIGIGRSDLRLSGAIAGLREEALEVEVLCRAADSP
jgi:hypothetical protein